jgi:hypothetical protein
MVVRLSALRDDSALHLRKIVWYSFLLQAKYQCNSTPGKITPTEKSNNHQGNRIRDLPACGIVIQPTALLCAYEIPVRSTFREICTIMLKLLNAQFLFLLPV